MKTQSGLSFAAVEALLTTNPTARARHMDWYGGVWLMAEHSRLSPGVRWLLSVGDGYDVAISVTPFAQVTDTVWNVG